MKLRNDDIILTSLKNAAFASSVREKGTDSMLDITFTNSNI